MGKIIVSYRRSDSAATTGRIYDRLVDRYGEASVFMDIDHIPFGTDFRDHIQEALRDADILLAVIGPNWLGHMPDGRVRIQDEADPVRVEIEAALRQELTVIPLLVDNATMPSAAELPETMRSFAMSTRRRSTSGAIFAPIWIGSRARSTASSGPTGRRWRSCWRAAIRTRRARRSGARAGSRR